MTGLFKTPKIEAAPQTPSVADINSQLAAEQVRNDARKKQGRGATVLAPVSSGVSVLKPPTSTFGGGT